MKRIRKEIERHTSAFVPSTASANAPDIVVRYRFDTIQNDVNALGAELNFPSASATKEGAGTGTCMGVGCGGFGGFGVGADVGV
jgi:hypothetical protein